jgi:hypothetical protein
MIQIQVGGNGQNQMRIPDFENFQWKHPLIENFLGKFFTETAQACRPGADPTCGRNAIAPDGSPSGRKLGFQVSPIFQGQNFTRQTNPPGWKNE